MKRRLLLSFSLALMCGGLLAQPVGVADALVKAKQFCTTAVSKRQMSPARNSAGLQLVYTFKSPATQDNCFYVFNRGTGDGYILVSAESRTKEILGFTDKGSFDINVVPANMKCWMEEYARQIEYAQTHPQQELNTVSATDGKSVSPLLTCTWDQGYPYNMLCPSRCATGCVATAMSQVMYKHKWPEKGSGSHSYTTETNGYKLSADFGNTTYLWSSMLDKYNGMSSDESKKAVATLMFHAGVSVDMDYDTSSGAYSEFVAPALYHYFNYDKGIHIVVRNYYDPLEWENMLRNELDNGRPVIYDGATKKFEGHSFVCDGYNADGYFHINWGWNGAYNGYFLTSALNPSGQGTGGSASGEGYNYFQDMILGIQKPVEGSSIVYSLNCDTIPDFSARVARSKAVDLSIKYVWNYTIDTLRVEQMGYVIFNPNGQTLVQQQSMFVGDLKPGTGYNAFSGSFSVPDSIKPGNYKASLCYKLKGESTWRKMNIARRMPQNLYVTVTADSAFYSMAATTSELKATDIQPDTLQANEASAVNATITNNGSQDYEGSIHYEISANNSTVFTSGYKNVSLAKGKSLTINMNDFITLGKGDYVLAFYDGLAKISDDKTIYIKGEELPADLNLTDPLSFNLVNGKVPKDNMVLTAVVMNYGGFVQGYADPLFL